MKLKPAKKPGKKDVWKKGTTVPKKATKKPESELHLTLNQWAKIIEEEDKKDPPRGLWQIASDLEECLADLEKTKYCLEHASDDFVDMLRGEARLIAMISLAEDLIKKLEPRIEDLVAELHKANRVLKRQEAAAAKKSKS